MFTSFQVVGAVVSEPELKYSSKGTAICEIHIGAANFAWKDRGMTLATTSIPITLFGKKAEQMAEEGAPGKPVVMTGHIEGKEWEGRDGNKKLQLQLLVDTLYFPTEL